MFLIFSRLYCLNLNDFWMVWLWTSMCWSLLYSFIFICTAWVALDQRLANFSCKGADGRLPRLCPFCPRDSALLLQRQSSRRQYVYKWLQLCSSKTFMKIGCGLDLAHELSFASFYSRLQIKTVISGKWIIFCKHIYYLSENEKYYNNEVDSYVYQCNYRSSILMC